VPWEIISEIKKIKSPPYFGKYILDFYCPEDRIAIELDGQSHENSEVQDQERQKFIENFKINVLRFNNYDVYRNLNLILEAILSAVPPRPADAGHPSLLRRG